MIQNPLLRSIFGAIGQIVVGCFFLLATATQTVYWTLITEPTVMAVFLVSMEALGFAAYAIIATGLGYLATEKVAQKQEEDADVQEVLDELKNNH